VTISPPAPCLSVSSTGPSTLEPQRMLLRIISASSLHTLAIVCGHSTRDLGNTQMSVGKECRPCPIRTEVHLCRSRLAKQVA